MHLTPRERALPELEHWPYINGILLVNSFCVVTHLLFGAPSAGEATRGYMHGGLLLDFVGQLGPTSKIRLFLLDLMILALQLTMMSATTKRKKMTQIRGDNRVAGLSLHAEPALLGQDLDAEERGVAGRDSWSPTGRLIEPESSYLLRPSPTGDNPSQTDLFALSDLLYSGQENIVQLWVWDAMCEQFRLVRAEALSPTSSLSNLLRNDMRRRAYDLSIPFHN
jgi:Fungal domain of unknown function (DUF1746)